MAILQIYGLKEGTKEKKLQGVPFQKNEKSNINFNIIHQVCIRWQTCQLLSFGCARLNFFKGPFKIEKPETENESIHNSI